MKFFGDAGGAASFTYVGEEYSKAISQYRTDNRNNGAPVCQIPVPYAYPQGMSTDKFGTLYTTALFLGAKHGVATFAPRCGNAGPTFNDTAGIPDDPVVDGDRLYLANLINVGGGATIEVYDVTKGPNPVAQLSDPSVYSGIGVALDSHHNLFWSYTTSRSAGGQVIEFRSGAMPGVVAVKIGSDFPGGLLLDRANNLLLVDQSNRSIYIYSPPYNTPPFSTISLKGTALFCAMGLQQRRLYCLDYEYGAVDVYAYPAGTYIYSYTNGIDASSDPIGIAIQPPFAAVRPLNHK